VVANLDGRLQSRLQPCERPQAVLAEHVEDQPIENLVEMLARDAMIGAESVVQTTAEVLYTGEQVAGGIRGESSLVVVSVDCCVDVADEFLKLWRIWKARRFSELCGLQRRPFPFFLGPFVTRDVRSCHFRRYTCRP